MLHVVLMATRLTHVYITLLIVMIMSCWYPFLLHLDVLPFLSNGGAHWFMSIFILDVHHNRFYAPFQHLKYFYIYYYHCLCEN